MEDMNRAKALLDTGDYTCVLCRGDRVYTSTHRGVKPLLELLDTDVAGFCAADKVVGKATALLYSLLQIKAVHAKIISRAAIDVLQAQGIRASWDWEVEYIKNREGNGRCPMEMATQNISDPREALVAIENKLKQLQR